MQIFKALIFFSGNLPTLKAELFSFNHFTFLFGFFLQQKKEYQFNENSLILHWTYNSVSYIYLADSTNITIFDVNDFTLIKNIKFNFIYVGEKINFLRLSNSEITFLLISTNKSRIILYNLHQDITTSNNNWLIVGIVFGAHIGLIVILYSIKCANNGGSFRNNSSYTGIELSSWHGCGGSGGCGDDGGSGGGGCGDGGGCSGGCGGGCG